MWRLLAVGVLLAGTSACSARLQTLGNEPDPKLVAEITPGVSTRSDVAHLLGSPSSVSVFDNETWYYISQRDKVEAFFKPEVVERKVLVIHYNKQGVVADVGTLGLADGKDVQFVQRTTPTLGNKVTIFNQLIGNFGRFNTEKDK